jgi:hypothetical protein
MHKHKFFTGQPVFSQLLSLIPAGFIRTLSSRYQADRYCKTFRASDHLVTMLYACFHRCHSLREVVTGLSANYNKLGQLGLRQIPCRSTFAEANQRRCVTFFEQLYHQLYQHYYSHLPDSRRCKTIESRLFIMDSTTITLFADIMKAAGCPTSEGRRKGGAKAHVLLDGQHDVPALIRLTEAARNDRIFMADVKLPQGSILVFDKGYHHFAQWQQWTDQRINWVTRLIDSEVTEVLSDQPVTTEHCQKGVIADQVIILGRGTLKTTHRIRVRLITYRDAESGKIYRFLCNNFKFSPLTIADIYKGRWQIELFFKRFKQHNPIHFFLGNNENAIKIQLWCSFIADLLVKVIKDQTHRRWSFANLSAIIRHNLMSYLHLKDFLNHPDKLVAPGTLFKPPDLFNTEGFFLSTIIKNNKYTGKKT